MAASALEAFAAILATRAHGTSARAPQRAACQPTAQKAPFVRHDRQPAFERLHRRVEAGETDGVEVYVGALHQAVERGPRLPRQENYEFVRIDTGALEGGRQPG